MTVETLSFELAANHLRDAVFVLDPSGKILWANQAAAAAAGRNAESLVNLRLTEILTPRSSEIAEPVLGSERPPGGAPALIELDILRPDLSSRRLEVSLSRLAGNNVTNPCGDCPGRFRAPSPGRGKAPGGLSNTPVSGCPSRTWPVSIE